jgi:cell filamentation protein
MRKLFERLAHDRFLRGLPPAEFARRAAQLLAELNAIDPFREGNGRTQFAYFTLLAANARHPLALERLNPEAMLSAMIASFRSDDAPLAALIAKLIEP